MFDHIKWVGGPPSIVRFDPFGRWEVALAQFSFVFNPWAKVAEPKSGEGFA